MAVTYFESILLVVISIPLFIAFFYILFNHRKFEKMYKNSVGNYFPLVLIVAGIFGFFRTSFKEPFILLFLFGIAFLVVELVRGRSKTKRKSRR